MRLWDSIFSLQQPELFLNEYFTLGSFLIYRKISGTLHRVLAHPTLNFPYIYMHTLFLVTQQDEVRDKLKDADETEG